MNRRGQALVEFVLILPVFLLILFTVVDFGNLLVTKNTLESQSTDIILLLKEGKSVHEVMDLYPGVDINLSTYQDQYSKVLVKKKVSFVNPLFFRIFGNPFYATVERVVPNDK